MKTKELTYEEAKQLILQGYNVKLPPWKGYWTKSTKDVGGIEVHLKNGDIVYTPDIKYTFYDNWEIATSENCEVLRKEIEAGKTNKEHEKPDIRILDYAISPVTDEMTVKVLFVDSNELKYLNFDDFLNIVDDNILIEGKEKVLNKIINEIVVSQLPYEEQDTGSSLLNNLQGLLEVLEETDVLYFLDKVPELPDPVDDHDGECNCVSCQQNRILEKGIENNVNPFDVLVHLKKAIDHYDLDN